jgi:hypothetical protein
MASALPIANGALIPTSQGNISFSALSAAILANLSLTSISSSESTGLRFGGTVSINALDDTTFDIAAGGGEIADYADPENPNIISVTWDQKIGVTLTDPGNPLSFIGIDVNGDVVQLASAFDENDRRIYIRLGAVTHLSGATITNTSTVPVIAYDTNSTLVDFINAAGVRNRSGNVYSSSSALTISKTSGTVLRYAGSYTVDPANPNVVNSDAQDTSTGNIFLRMMRDGAGGWISTVQTSLDPENYDDGSGVLQTVTKNFWQVFYVWQGAAEGSDFTLIQQGQDIYPNKDSAQLSLTLNQIEVNPTLASTLRRAAIIVKQGTVNLASEAFFYEYDDSGLVPLSPNPDVSIPLNRSYTFTSQGIGSGTHYIGGFYEAPVTDANLTQAAPTATFANANEGHASHAFIVASGAGAASGGTGTVEIEVSGVSITDGGVRTPADTEIVAVDITAMTANQYLETSKKWIGTVTWTLQNSSGSTHTTFNADVNFGIVKHEDFGNRNFTITDFETVGQANANDTTFNIQLLKHQFSGWTYHATAFSPGSSTGILADMQVDYSTEAGIRNNFNFAYKRDNISEAVGGNNGEGCLIRVVTGAASSVQVMTSHIIVEV